MFCWPCRNAKGGVTLGLVQLVNFNAEGVIKAEEVGVGRDQARLDLHSRVLS